ncbi:peptide chain release factor N(5)-glutamine methyltransferase [Pedobacter sp. AW31-3R]|uniref:peptide chain release factor N(5)-glutamine methyltransferase n=1 Tax=Pedobacter sp. AW31-3R TaxID=3445781 RepID=UPI003FA00966
MNLQELQHCFVKEVSAIYDEEEARALFYLLASHVDGLGRTQVLMNPAMELTEEKIAVYMHMRTELQQGKPIQYILGEAEFYGLTFKVNPEVLIPRPETEELIEWILSTIQSGEIKPLSILDIGTGSGCIPVTLKQYLEETEVTGLDISPRALDIARENALRNRTEVQFIQADILNYTEGGRYDLIVSNPPYIKEDEREAMHENVLSHEPHLALFVSNERPLVFYEAIATFALEHLHPEGALFFEINEYLGRETLEMLQEKGFKQASLKKDMQGKDRMIFCRHPEFSST